MEGPWFESASALLSQVVVCGHCLVTLWGWGGGGVGVGGGALETEHVSQKNTEIRHFTSQW